MIRLASQFVAAADEVWTLQRGADPESRFFQSFADKAHYQGKGGTRQGIYVCTPRGELLASINSLSPDKVLGTMREGLASWNQLSANERETAPSGSYQPFHRWELSFPTDGLVLESVVRDLEPTGRAIPARGKHWNRDHVWFTREEMRGWLPPTLRVGAKHKVPDVIADRLARFHLVDNAHGQTLPYAPQEVKSAKLETEIVSRRASTVRLRISGQVRAKSDGPWLLGDSTWKPDHEHPHGTETRLLGFATYDLESESFVAFDLVAVGQRWGRTQFNGRKSDCGYGLIGFIFTLVSDGPASRVPPTFIDVYNADWVVRPRGARRRQR